MFVRSVLIATLAMATAAALAQKAPPRVIAIDRVIAVVNDEAITQYELDDARSIGDQLLAIVWHKRRSRRDDERVEAESRRGRRPSPPLRVAITLVRHRTTRSLKTLFAKSRSTVVPFAMPSCERG